MKFIAALSKANAFKFSNLMRSISSYGKRASFLVAKNRFSIVLQDKIKKLFIIFTIDPENDTFDKYEVECKDSSIIIEFDTDLFSKIMRKLLTEDSIEIKLTKSSKSRDACLLFSSRRDDGIKISHEFLVTVVREKEDDIYKYPTTEFDFESSIIQPENAKLAIDKMASLSETIKFYAHSNGNITFICKTRNQAEFATDFGIDLDSEEGEVIMRCTVQSEHLKNFFALEGVCEQEIKYFYAQDAWLNFVKDTGFCNISVFIPIKENDDNE